LETGEPVGVPDIAATMDWPGFHEVAPALGLRASVSVPLYNGRGTTIAVLNLYGRDDAAMAPLIVRVAELYATSRKLDLDAVGPIDLRSRGRGTVHRVRRCALRTRHHPARN
jgi:hypothetical protein